MIGHQNQREALATLLKEDRLPSSLLFSGPSGIGKKLAALELAIHLLCKAPPSELLEGCGECSACKLSKVGNHPDLRILECGGDDMSVDVLRQTLERLSLQAFMGNRKVTILNDADLLSIVGANILLKTLEEPRAESFFILIASTPSRLPQTVLSRCQRWFFDRLATHELETIVRERGGSEQDLSLVPFADGSVESLDSIRSKSDLGDDVRSTLVAAWKGDRARIIKASQDWGSDKAGIRECLAFIRTAIRQNLLDSAYDQDASAVWANALQNALDAEYLVLERHTNPTLALLHLLESCSHSLASAYRCTPNSKPTLLERLTA